jgi:hypothetical protein
MKNNKKRISFFLPEELVKEIKKEAFEKDVSPNIIVEQRLSLNNAKNAENTKEGRD